MAEGAVYISKYEDMVYINSPQQSLVKFSQRQLEEMIPTLVSMIKTEEAKDRIICKVLEDTGFDISRIIKDSTLTYVNRNFDYDDQS